MESEGGPRSSNGSCELHFGAADWLTVLRDGSGRSGAPICRILSDHSRDLRVALLAAAPYPTYSAATLVGVPGHSAAPSLCGCMANVVARVQIQSGVDLQPGCIPGILHGFRRRLCSTVVAAGIQLAARISPGGCGLANGRCSRHLDRAQGWHAATRRR